MGTHIYNACHPPTARSSVCSGSENEQQTAAHSSVRILRCLRHMKGQLKRQEKKRCDTIKGQHWKKSSIFQKLINPPWFVMLVFVTDVSHQQKS